MGLSLEVLRFATLLVVVVIHPAVVAATGISPRKLRRCFEMLVSNEFMLEDVTLHMLLPVVYFCFRLLLHEVRRTVWGAFLSAIALEIRFLIFFNLARFSSVFFFLVFLFFIRIFHPPCVEV